MKKRRRSNPIARAVRSPAFRPRVVRDRTKYRRKGRKAPEPFVPPES